MKKFLIKIYDAAGCIGTVCTDHPEKWIKASSKGAEVAGLLWELIDNVSWINLTGLQGSANFE